MGPEQVDARARPDDSWRRAHQGVQEKPGIKGECPEESADRRLAGGGTGVEVLLAGHKVNQGTLEGGIPCANPKLFRDEPSQSLISERDEPGRTAVAAD
jgi:hypothetical protein